ncbi:hypothetical protein I4F81_000520 [Pyropia yezoensis]|uniref:Uncharacterized protein n=1 Tax=Pyropia yezoensis TaxID=2788 RepID=A0ACC3BJI7_PYRYE|nr:hypothetical protein I4F81_000520 [Neopyropia yezoensis]|eukprot:contig_5963_g1356
MVRPAWLHRPSDPPVGTRPRLPTAASSFGSSATDWTDVTDAPATAPAWSASGDVYIELAADKDVCVKDGVMYVGGAATAAGQKALGGVGGGNSAAAGATAGDAAGEKKKKAKVKDYMKTSLSSERTFFKWVWTGLQFGALGTFVFVSFVDEGPPLRLMLVVACWMIGFAAAVYGLLQYHRRRRALLADNPDPAAWESPAAPGVVVSLFFCVIVAILTYSIITEQHHLAVGLGPKAPTAPEGGDR